MYIRNIIKAIDNLTPDERIRVNFRSGKTCFIIHGDRYENENGDLKITRENIYTGRVILYIDCAEVESITITNGD